MIRARFSIGFRYLLHGKWFARGLEVRFVISRSGLVGDIRCRRLLHSPAFSGVCQRV